MPILANATKAVTDRMPKVISPGVHAIIDYATAGTFFAMGALFWNRNKRAAVSSMVCGAAEAITATTTDYPGGVVKAMSFTTHGRIDVGLAALVSSLPGLMKFTDEAEARFFGMQAIAMAGVTGLTDFEGSGRTRQLKRLRKKAA